MKDFDNSFFFQLPNVPTSPPFIPVTPVSEFPMIKYIFIKFVYNSQSVDIDVLLSTNMFSFGFIFYYEQK